MSIELGAANYGPLFLENMQREKVFEPEFLPSGKQHTILKTVADDVIYKNWRERRMTFYLNDIDERGLDCAADSLREHLTERKRRGELKGVEINIVKIAADMITFRKWPEVDNAQLLNPHFTITCSDLFHSLIDPNKSVSPRAFMLRVLQRVSRVSRQGVYVSDINHSKNYMGVIKEIIKAKPETFRECLKRHGLSCLPARIQSLSKYFYPNGTKITRDCITFRAFNLNEAL